MGEKAMSRLWACLLVAAALAALARPASAQVENNRVAQDLKRLTIEELADVDITSASRRVAGRTPASPAWVW